MVWSAPLPRPCTRVSASSGSDLASACSREDEPGRGSEGGRAKGGGGEHALTVALGLAVLWVMYIAGMFRWYV